MEDSVWPFQLLFKWKNDYKTDDKTEANFFYSPIHSLASFASFIVCLVRSCHHMLARTHARTPLKRSITSLFYLWRNDLSKAKWPFKAKTPLKGRPSRCQKSSVPAMNGKTRRMSFINIRLYVRLLRSERTSNEVVWNVWNKSHESVHGIRFVA